MNKQGCLYRGLNLLALVAGITFFVYCLGGCSGMPIWEGNPYFPGFKELFQDGTTAEKTSATEGESKATATDSTDATKESAATKDELDPSLVTWDEPAAKDAGSWPITATITAASVTSSKIKFAHAALTWKELTKEGWDKPARGNAWIVGKCSSDGKWHGCTMEWIRDQQEIDQRKWNGEDNLHSSCLSSDFRPAAGTEAYVMLSTFARGGIWTTKERTQLVKVVWP